MNKKWQLFKVLIRTSDILQFGNDSKKAWVNLLKTLGIVALILFAAVSMGFIVYPAYDILSPLRLQWVIIKVIFLLASVTSIITAFLFILVAFYFSQDIENQIYLPISSGDLIFSKLAIVTIYEMITNLIFFLPALLIYGYRAKENPLFYIKSVISLALVPIVPMALVGILVMIIMRSSSFFKNKERFTSIAMALSILFALGINIVISKLITFVEKGSFIPPVLTGDGPSGKILSFLFPSAMLLSDGFRYKELFLATLFICLLICLIVLVSFYFVGERYYIDGAIGLDEISSKRVKLSESSLKSLSRGKRPLVTIALKEIKSLFRTPSYFLNGILSPIIMPIIALLVLFTNEGMGDNGGHLLMHLAKLGKDLNHWPIVFLMVNIPTYMNSALNMMSPTIISREGQAFYFMKTQPQTYRTQILGRLIPSFIFVILGNLVISLGEAYIFKIDLKLLLPALVFSLLTSLASIFITTLPDIVNPKINWSNEMKAMKQNPNIFFVFLINALLIGTLYLISLFVKLSVLSLTYILMAFVILTLVAYLLFIEKLARWSFDRIN